MSLVRFFQPANRLAEAIAAPGGKLVSEAVADADVGLAATSDACLARIDARLAAMQAAGAAGDRAALYGAAREIAGLAGICGKSDLGAAALSLCNLLDHTAETGRMQARHMLVYVEVMRSLRSAVLASQAQRAEMLATLSALAVRLTVG